MFNGDETMKVITGSDGIRRAGSRQRFRLKAQRIDGATLTARSESIDALYAFSKQLAALDYALMALEPEGEGK